MSNNILGNTTTIINWIVLIILPYASAYGVTQSQLVAVVSAIIGILFAIINSKYPNTFAFLGNNTETVENEEITTEEEETEA